MNGLKPRGGDLAVLISAMLVLTACQGLPVYIPADPAERVTSGDRIQVLRELSVPANRASITVQHGRLVSGAADRFEASCRFVMQESRNAPQKIVPGLWRVTGVRYREGFTVPDIRRFPFSGGELISYEVTMNLSPARQSGLHSLVCRHDDEQVDGQHLKVSEMQQALGNLARIIKP